MVAGLGIRLNHEDAARFSFLLGTPIIGAAALLEVPQLSGQPGSVLLLVLMGMVLAGVAAGDLAFLLTGDLVTFLVFAALIGLGDFFSSSQTALLSEIVPPQHRTSVLAGYRFSSDLGAFLGPVVLAAVMDVANAQVAIALAAAILLSASLAARLGVPGSVDERAPRMAKPAPALEVAADGSD